MNCPSIYTGSHCDQKQFHEGMHTNKADRKGWGISQDDYDALVRHRRDYRRAAEMIGAAIQPWVAQDLEWDDIKLIELTLGEALG